MPGWSDAQATKAAAALLAHACAAAAAGAPALFDGEDELVYLVRSGRERERCRPSSDAAAAGEGREAGARRRPAPMRRPAPPSPQVVSLKKVPQEKRNDKPIRL
jgi:hypothetical protein